MYKKLKSFLNSIHKLDDGLFEEYISHWNNHFVPKKTIITPPDSTEKYTYLVMDGIQKSYFIKDDKKYIIAFTYPYSFSGNPQSFLTQSPSKYYFETITDSSFLRLSYQKHQELMSEFPEVETLFRKATEMVLVGMIQRHYELMAHDIETRFKDFVRRSPHMLNMVSQKDLASYLRIDAANFSRLLNNVEI
ncbi:MAG: cyclic nucleotide-binding protein [Flammeovirgaceae bacterium]|nr:cyclic nucleotide-binding protein [Flammeovirgaceae bacterium]|tara:strand:- start:493 stop:1065 length:573 start_codon:yes stop_codon:yes gene_type:complete